MSVAFDNAELRALNAANIDCDITFMQVWCFVVLQTACGLVREYFFSQFLECLVAVASCMEKSDVVSIAIKVKSRCASATMFLSTRPNNACV